MRSGAEIVNKVLTGQSLEGGSGMGGGFVGNLVTDEVSLRVYLNQAPQGVTLPCITFFQVTSDPNNSLSGPSSLWRERWQVDCWADRYATAKTVAESVRTVMLGAAGTNNIVSITMLSELAQFEREESLHRVILDFSIWHT